MGAATAGTRPWSLTLAVLINREMEIQAKTVARIVDKTPAITRFETFGVGDLTPTTAISTLASATVNRCRSP